MNALEIVQEAAMGCPSGEDWFGLVIHGARLVVWYGEASIVVGDRDTGRCLTFTTLAGALDSITSGNIP